MNWYKTSKLNIKIAQRAKEYWIDDSGNILEANGEGYEYNHEARAIEEAQSIVKEKSSSHPVFSNLVNSIFGEKGNYDHYDPIGSREEMLNWADNAIIEGIITEEQGDDICGTIAKESGVDEELLDIALGHGGNYAARDYAIKNWNWMALRGVNLEMPNLSRHTLLSAIKGINKVFGEKAEVIKFNITERASNKYYPDVPFYEMKRGPMALYKHEIAY